MLAKLKFVFWPALLLQVLITLLPFFILFPGPRNDSQRLLSLLSLVLIAGLAIRMFFVEKRTFVFSVLSILSGVSFLAVITLKIWPQDGSLDGLTTNYLGALLHLDGESAYDAALFESFCEIWMVLFVMASVSVKLLQKQKAN